MHDGMEASINYVYKQGEGVIQTSTILHILYVVGFANEGEMEGQKTTKSFQRIL